jgi:hypothetical protein
MYLIIVSLFATLEGSILAKAGLDVDIYS